MKPRRWIVVFAVGALVFASEAAQPVLTGLGRERGLDSAWLWFPETATSLQITAGQLRSGYRLITVDHATGRAQIQTPDEVQWLSFGSSATTAGIPSRSAEAVQRRATENAARALGLSAEEIPVNEGEALSIDQIAAHSRRRLHTAPEPLK